MGRKSLESKIGAIGIGSLIIFIAMVLVAGIAASVLIQTSSHLEAQSSATGRETTKEVATGLTIYSIEAYADNSSDISKLAIMIRPRAGTDSIDLTTTNVELSDENIKVVLNYTTSFYSKPDGLSDIFSANVYPDDIWAYHDWQNTDATQFGLLVLDDPDDSISSTNPFINRGDKVYLCFNTTGIFNDIAENTHIWGQVMPEYGYPAMIDFRTPMTYANNVMEIHWDM